jgi:hypothetical protein
MLIDVEIALGFDGEIERAMASDKVEHVIEEADSGGGFRGSPAVEIQAKPDVGLVGFAIDCSCASARHCVFSLSEISESA